MHLNIFAIIISINFCVGKRYDKYPLLRALPSSLDHLEFFKNVSDIYDINYWQEPGLVNMHVLFTINPLDSYKFVKEADSRGINLTTVMKDVQRSKVLIEGGIHAREWISPAFVTYFINEIVKAPESKNKELKRIALTYEWYFIPVLNPDGYEYTMTEDRLWRKNRRDGYGVDLNRNFGAAFGTVGVSRNKTSAQTFCGPQAFSEPESIAMAQFVRGLKNQLEYFISFHSFGQLFIIPYAFSTKHAENFDEMKSIGDATAKKIKKRYGHKYMVGTAFDTVGIPTNEKEIAFFSNLSKLYEVVYWRRTVVPNKPVDFTISPTDLPRFLDSALDSGIPLTTLIEDVQSKSDKYDETYCGPSAFSEPETRVMAEFTRENSKNLMYYIAFHAYGQFFIIPYSFTPKQFDNYNDMVKLGYHVAAKIHKEYKTEYTVGNAYSCVGYLASGSSTDWVKKAFKTKRHDKSSYDVI
ncbi:hypothetical protein MSG28_006747 [Choristoneura fumiferana]|uniref:Uncharacterized protein n=1 Tax=Choristoneura fumiferana TaxID=7141 RepID=A0ACC0JL18_CHOFU|nr:hypothetical protein MSG28_006747 [Choristoneura fumiferana]